MTRSVSTKIKCVLDNGSIWVWFHPSFFWCEILLKCEINFGNMTTIKVILGIKKKIAKKGKGFVLGLLDLKGLLL